MFHRFKIPALLLAILLLPLSLFAQVYYGGENYNLEEWDKSVFELAGSSISLSSLDNIRDSLDISIVGEIDNHTLKFTQTDSVILPGTRILITFPEDFDLEAINTIEYFDDDGANTDFSIDSFLISDRSFYIFLDDSGTTPVSGSLVEVKMAGVVNATVSGSYRLALTLTDSNGIVMAGPDFTQPFLLSPGTLDSIEVVPGGVQQIRAGNTFQFDCICYDSFTNVLDCPSQSWSLESSTVTGEIDSTGLFLAQFVGPFHAVCEIGGLIDSSDLVFVVAGNPVEFNMTGFPDTLTAGKKLGNSVYVEAKDFYGNRVRSYLGQVWFESSDTSAELIIDSTNKYQFQEGDQGDKLFGDSAFIFHTAGQQTIRVTDGSISSDDKYIIILADRPSDLTISLPDTVSAGQEFSIEVSNLADASGNPISGIVDVQLLGDGTAPDGTEPRINRIFADAGNGEALQKISKAGEAGFIVSIDTISRLIQPIFVKNAGSDHIKFVLASPQIVGVPFTGQAELTVLDEFDNIVTDFDASATSVTVSALGEGNVINGLISGNEAFVDGVCDLTQFDMYYSGPARFLKFRAATLTGVQGSSGTIEINSASIEQLSLSTAALYRGDEFSAAVTISNFGSLELTVNDIDLTSTQGEMLIDSISPALPNQISGNSSTIYEVYTSIPLTFNSEVISFRSSFSGLYNQQTISDSSDFLDSLRILSQQEATYSDESLTPLIMSKGSEYAMRLELMNLGEAVISLNTESFLQFAAEQDTFRTSLEIPTFLPTTGAGVDLFFEETELFAGFESGTHELTLFLFGLQGGSEYSEELILSDSVTVQSPPDIAYVEDSFKPDSVYRGSEMTPVLQIENAGEAVLVLDRELSRLELEADGRQIIFRPEADGDSILPGQNQITFETVRVPSDFPVSFNSIALHLEGSANQHNQNFDIEIGDGILTILEQGAIQIISTSNLSPNSPRVNIEQRFDVNVKVKNLGQEALKDIWIQLEGENSLIENDSLIITLLEPDQTDSVLFSIIATDIPNTAEIFRAAVLSASGVQTGSSGIILNPEDNTAAATVELPARISAALSIVSPPDALGGRLSINQQFTLQAEFSNSGQADVDLGMATLYLPEGFATNDPLDVAFEIDDPVSWNISAPGAPQVAELIMEITSAPNDLNSQNPAIVEKDADTVDITVEEQLPSAFVDWLFESYDLVYPGQTLPVAEFEFFTELSNGSQAILTGMAFEFTDREGRAFELDELLLSGSMTFNQITYPGTISSNTLSFDFGEDVVFDGQNAAVLDLQVVIDDQTMLDNFIISTDSSLVTANDYRFDVVGSPLEIKAADGSGFAISKSYGAVPSDFESSFYNYPNPFNPDKESTLIVYYLPNSSDIDLTIYTLIGEEVFSTNFPAGSPGAQGGTINRVYWNGRNGESLIVREGVYLAVIKFSGGEARTKIAVVK